MKNLPKIIRYIKNDNMLQLWTATGGYISIDTSDAESVQWLATIGYKASDYR